MEAIKSTDTEKILQVAKNYDKVIILSEEEYETLDELRCIQRGEEDILAGKVYTHEQVFTELKKRAAEFLK